VIKNCVALDCVAKVRQLFYYANILQSFFKLFLHRKMKRFIFSELQQK